VCIAGLGVLEAKEAVAQSVEEALALLVKERKRYAEEKIK
jgi:hypothetical protein